MSNYNKITALYSRLSVGDEDRDGGESNSIQNQKIFLENYAKGQHLTNIRHYIDDDESGRFFDRSAYSRMIEDVESGKIGVCIMKDLTRWGRDYLQVGNAMEIFRRNNVRFIAVNNGIDSENPDTLEFAPFINIMSEWYAKDISKKVKTGIKTKGMSGKPIATEAPYGYIKAPDNKDFWIIDEEAAEVVRLIFRLFLDGKNRNQIAVYLTQEQIPTPTFYMKDRGRGTCKNKTLNEDNRYKWNKATLTHILTRQEYCGDVVNFKTTKHFRDKRNHYVDRSQWHITENVHEPIIDRTDFENVQRILENAPVKRPNGDGEIHPLSGLLFCKDCGAKMHIRIDYRNGGKRHVAYCSEYHKGKAKNPKCSSPHIMDADLLMQTVADVLKKIAEYSISNRAEFEALVKKSLAMQQTDKTKKQQKRIPQITTRLEQIDKVLNKLYEDNALGTIPQDRYEQMSQKYSEEYYSLKAELEQLREQLSAFENAGGRAQKFVKLIDRYADFTDLTPTTLPVCFIPVSLPAHTPDLRNTVFQPNTILSPDSFPFVSLPTDHQLELPDILHSEIPYQSISLMTIIHIFCYNCCNLIFLLSWCHSPFIYHFRRDALNQVPLLKSFFFANQLPATPYRPSLCLLSTGAWHAPVIK